MAFAFLKVIATKSERLNVTLMNHEKIHIVQQKDLFFIFFLLLYVLEFIFNVFRYFDIRKAYWLISFEREAYAHQHDNEYLELRIKYSFYSSTLLMENYKLGIEQKESQPFDRVGAGLFLFQFLLYSYFIIDWLLL